MERKGVLRRFGTCHIYAPGQANVEIICQFRCSMTHIRFKGPVRMRRLPTLSLLPPQKMTPQKTIIDTDPV
jgi:hypothetical protein